MKDKNKTKEQLINELAEIRQRITKSEIPEVKQKRLEEQAKTTAIINAMIDGVTITDMQGKITNINRAISRRLGYGKKEAIGRTPGELFITEKDRSALRRLKYIGNTNRVCYTKLLYVLHQPCVLH